MVTDLVKRLQSVTTQLERHVHPAAHPIYHLISGYLIQAAASDGTTGLQLRRSLDDYFFTHLQSSGTKDTGQVLWRHFKAYHPQQDPKIFMVDQLWMWILDDSKCQALYRMLYMLNHIQRDNHHLFTTELGRMGI